MFMMKNSSLESYTIKFLYNLSFDVTLCDDILKVGLLPKITDLIGIQYIIHVINYKYVICILLCILYL